MDEPEPAAESIPEAGTRRDRAGAGRPGPRGDPGGRRGPAALEPRRREPLVRRGRDDAGRAGRRTHRDDRSPRPDRRHPRALASPGPARLAPRLRPLRPRRPGFSALCGLATVAVVYLIGRDAYDHRTGLWSAWLTAVCPPLVYYSQEARMYAWLVLLTALSWLVLLSFRRSAGIGRCVVYALLLAALAYSHPLGLFMIAAHGLAYLLVRPALRLRLTSWALIQLGVVLAISPGSGATSTTGPITRCRAIRSGTCWRSRSSTSAATAWCCWSAWRSSPWGCVTLVRGPTAAADVSGSTTPPRA